MSGARAARLERRGLALLDLLTEDLRAAVASGSVRGPLGQVSSPCWYRYETLAFEDTAPGRVVARVRVDRHFWPGDDVGGPPRSWEQEIGLVETPAGWRVERLSEVQDEREEPGEPHGPTISACTVARGERGDGAVGGQTVGATRPAGPTQASVDQFELAAYLRLGRWPIPGGGSPAYVGDGAGIVVRARVRNARRLGVAPDPQRAGHGGVGLGDAGRRRPGRAAVGPARGRRRVRGPGVRRRERPAAAPGGRLGRRARRAGDSGRGSACSSRPTADRWRRPRRRRSGRAGSSRRRARRPRPKPMMGRTARRLGRRCG